MHVTNNTWGTQSGKRDRTNHCKPCMLNGSMHVQEQYKIIEFSNYVVSLA